MATLDGEDPTLKVNGEVKLGTVRVSKTSNWSWFHGTESRFLNFRGEARTFFRQLASQLGTIVITFLDGDSSQGDQLCN
jgi:hypothetical protein